MKIEMITGDLAPAELCESIKAVTSMTDRQEAAARGGVHLSTVSNLLNRKTPITKANLDAMTEIIRIARKRVDELYHYV